jgi:membrane protease YdiL (CAAX protease family)
VNPSRPRLWTLAVACVALVIGIIGLTVLAWAVAMVVVPPSQPLADATLSVERLQKFVATPAGLVFTAAVSSLWIGGLAVVAGALSPVPFAERLCLGRPQWKAIGWPLAIVGGLALSEGADAFLQWSGLGRGETLEQLAAALRQARGLTLVLAVITIGLLAGTAEELFFRGYLQSRLVQRLGAPAGIAIASVLFAIAHLDQRHSFFALAFGGFVGWIVWRTGSVWPGVATHVVNNTASTLLPAWGVGEGNDTRTGHAIALVVSAVVLAAAIAGLRYVLPRNEAAS